MAVVQARERSTRLPGKVLMPLPDGRTVLEHVVMRVRRMETVDDVVVATGPRDANMGIAALCNRGGKFSVSCYHHDDEDDVLGRFHSAAAEWGADLIVRVTADCPLFDTALGDAVVRRGEPWSKHDFATNMHPPSFPRGFAVEVMTSDALERAHRRATTAYDREHVATWIYRTAPELHSIASGVNDTTESDVNLSVDTAEDLERVRGVLEWNPEPTWREALLWVRAQEKIAVSKR